MSYQGLIIIDGSQLSALDTSIPEDLRDGNMSAEQFFELGNSRVTECLNGFSLPSTVTFGFDDIYNFYQLLEEDPQRLLQDYFDVIMSRLKADPIVVSILDGSTIRPYLENEDDFVTLSEDLFTDLDINEEGEINSSQMRTALLYFGFKIDISSLSDFPIIDDILKKHGVEEGHDKLDRAQFAQLLKLMLQDIADALALDHIIVQRKHVKIATGGIPKQLSEEDPFLGIFTAVLYQQTSDDSEEEPSFEEVMKNFLENNAAAYGIPPFDANDEDVVRLYDAVFSDPEFQVKAIVLKKDEVGELGKKILEKFATELEAKPLLYNN